MKHLSFAALTALLALAAAAPAGAVAPPQDERPLRNIDVRKADGGPTTASERRARRELERDLGEEGTVSTDRISGGARMVARTDGALTRRRAAAPTTIALDYVRARPDVFGLDTADVDGLRLESRYRSADGISHLAYTQSYLGVAAYDNVLLANVAQDGRLLNVGGAAVGDLRIASVVPDLDAQAALAAAKREVGGALVPPRGRTGRGPERPTSFANGDSARLTLFNDGTATRLAWRLEVTGEHDYVYELVVDATSGRVLKRRSLTEFADALVYDNYPGAPAGGGPVTADLDGPDGTWLNRNELNTKLQGNNAHAYVDADDVDATTPGPTAGDLEVPANPGPPPNWSFPLQTMAGQNCPPSGCTWNHAVPDTRTTNRNQAATQLFYFVNRFHDHLAAAPIGFTHAQRGFEFDDADGAGTGGVGGDPVQAEVDNYLNPDGDLPISTDNATMTTRLDGVPPRLEAFLFTDPSLNSADTADVVYHEYTHGLTNRSVGSGVGLDANQSRAMGEGWSDWYALDYLEAEGLRDDIAAAGQMTLGDYLGVQLRTQGADCPVGSGQPACAGTATAGSGGYTLGDLGDVHSTGFEVHADGEIWLETLWDLRAALQTELGAVAGIQKARELVTSGLRLAPNNPSFLEARDAILLADREAGGVHYDLLWEVFAIRGMGFDASTSSSAATSAVESFALPPRLVHESTTATDTAGGDGDDVPERNETISITEVLRNPHASATVGITGQLSTTTPGATVGQATSAWPMIAAGATAPNSPPFEVTLPATASCDSTLQLGLDVTTTTPAAAFTIPLRVPVGSKASNNVPKTILTASAGVVSTLAFNGSGTVSDLEVRISKLAHTWVGDLRVILTNPTNTKNAVLMDRPGTDAEGANGDDFVDLVLDDDAATSIDNIPATNPPGGYTGRFRPTTPLSVFDGDDRQGTWTLTVIDEFPTDDSGTLYDWGIRPSGSDCPNRAPDAADDAHSTGGGQALNGASVLANDSDPDGDGMTAVKLGDPSHGSVSLAGDGTFTYTPDAGFRGGDSFTYRATDGSASSGVATVSITVGNAPPAAAADAFDATSGVTLSAPSVLVNDSDPNGDALSAVRGAGPEHGTLSLASDGTFEYTADAGFTGRDAFTYTASDGTSSSVPATVALTVGAGPVTPPPPPPPPLPPPPPPPTARAPAKLEVLRAGVSRGSLDVLAGITARASGKVGVRYRSAGRTTSFDATISDGQIRFRRSLPRAQRSKPTGIFTLTFRGTPAVAPDSVTLRAASGKARLVRTSSRISLGRLRVAGTISPRARGVVRVRLAYAVGGVSRALDFRARIAGGKWSLNEPLPAAAAAAGGQLSIQFTGYEPLRIRGEQISKAVSPGG